MTDNSEWDGESGPYCRHWDEPSMCTEVCATCGVGCRDHDDGVPHTFADKPPPPHQPGDPWAYHMAYSFATPWDSSDWKDGKWEVPFVIDGKHGDPIDECRFMLHGFRPFTSVGQCDVGMLASVGGRDLLAMPLSPMVPPTSKIRLTDADMGTEYMRNFNLSVPMVTDFKENRLRITMTKAGSALTEKRPGAYVGVAVIGVLMKQSALGAACAGQRGNEARGGEGE